MTTSHETRVGLTALVASFFFIAAAALMALGLTGAVDGTEYERGFEVFSEISIFSSLVIGYWFGRNSA